MYRKLLLLLLLCCVCTLLVTPTVGMAQRATPSAVETSRASDEAIRAAANQALVARPAHLFPGHALLNLQIQRAGDWALLTAALFDGPARDGEPSGGLFILARFDQRRWVAAVQGSTQFKAWLPLAPPELLDAAAKRYLDADFEAPDPSPQLVGPSNLSFPYPTGESWLFSGGPHGSPRSAVDFARNAGSVRAAADGVVSLPCGNLVVITHSDGWQTGYYHLRGIAVRNGQTVSRGTFLGYAWIGTECGGRAEGDHVHFSLRRNGTQLAIAGAVLGGWTVEQGANEYDGCLVKGSQRICVGGYVTNDGTVGTGGCVDTNPIGDGSSRSQMFIDAYNRKGGRDRVGCPVNGTHWWGDGSPRSVVIQDFRGGSAGDVAIIHDENRDSPAGSTPAYVLQGGIWQHYIRLGGWESWLGPPTSDEFENETGQAQNNFRSGYIAWNNGSPVAIGWPAPAAQQWYAEYHNGRNLNNYPTWVRNETSIDNNWGTGAPGNGRWGVWADNFSVRWTGDFTFAAGTYVFNAAADDGVRVFVDGALVIDGWRDQTVTQYRATRTLGAGTHRVVMEYYEGGGGAVARLWTCSLSDCEARAQSASDLLAAWSEGGSASFAIYPSTRTKFDLHYAWSARNGGWGSTDKWLSGDFDGDGLTDAASAWNDGGKVSIAVRRSTGAGFEPQTNWSSMDGGWGDADRWFSGDFDGDGVTDIASVWNNAGKVSISVRRSTRLRFDPQTNWPLNDVSWNISDKWVSGDFNGDGRADIAAISNDGGENTINAYLSTGSSFKVQSWAFRDGGWMDSTRFVASDFDGDRMSDIAAIWNDGGLVSVAVYRSVGAAFSNHTQWSIRDGGWMDSTQWIAGDFDGDGKVDIADIWNEGGMNTLAVRRSTGSSFRTNAAWGIRDGGWMDTTKWLAGKFRNP